MALSVDSSDATPPRPLNARKPLSELAKRLAESRLQNTIRINHGCGSTYLSTVSVIEVFDGKTVWEGDVHIFSLEGHHTADKCYAWTSPVEGSGRLRIYTVLHQPPVDSPAAAVRAAIVQQYREVNP